MQARQKVNMYPDFGIHSNSIVPGGFEVRS